MKDLMIDIETMGNGSNAAMIQLAGVYFDITTGETGGEFNMCLDLNDVIDHGFETDPDTEKWWSEQNQDVLKNILDNGKPVKEVMIEFSKFMSDAKRVWSHATFDFVIVQHYLRRFKLKGMPYKGSMDIRTLCYLSNINLDKYDWSQKTHDALDDCKFQIKYCCDAYKIISESKEKAWMYDEVSK